LRAALLVGLRWVSSSIIVLVVVVVIPTNRLSILARDSVWKGIEQGKGQGEMFQCNANRKPTVTNSNMIP